MIEVDFVAVRCGQPQRTSFRGGPTGGDGVAASLTMPGMTDADMVRRDRQRLV